MYKETFKIEHTCLHPRKSRLSRFPRLADKMVMQESVTCNQLKLKGHARTFSV